MELNSLDNFPEIWFLFSRKMKVNTLRINYLISAH